MLISQKDIAVTLERKIVSGLYQRRDARRVRGREGRGGLYAVSAIIYRILL